MIDTSIIMQWDIFIRIYFQKSAVKSMLFGKDADNKKRRIRSSLWIFRFLQGHG